MPSVRGMGLGRSPNELGAEDERLEEEEDTIGSGGGMGMDPVLEVVRIGEEEDVEVDVVTSEEGLVEEMNGAWRWV